jgi:hypothetical protein
LEEIKYIPKAYRQRNLKFQEILINMLFFCLRKGDGENDGNEEGKSRNVLKGKRYMLYYLYFT